MEAPMQRGVIQRDADGNWLVIPDQTFIVADECVYHGIEDGDRVEFTVNPETDIAYLAQVL